MPSLNPFVKLYLALEDLVLINKVLDHGLAHFLRKVMFRKDGPAALPPSNFLPPASLCVEAWAVSAPQSPLPPGFKSEAYSYHTSWGLGKGKKLDSFTSFS